MINPKKPQSHLSGIESIQEACRRVMDGEGLNRTSVVLKDAAHALELGGRLGLNRTSVVLKGSRTA